MLQTDVSETPIWKALSGCTTPDQAVDEVVRLMTILGKSQNEFLTKAVVGSKVGSPKAVFTKLIGEKLELYELSPKSMVYDAVAFFAFLTIPQTEEPVQKVMTISQNIADKKQVHLSLADKGSKPEGFAEVWSGKVVDVGRKWKQILLTGLDIENHGQSNTFGLGEITVAQLKQKIINHESQLKIRCYCGKMLRCEPQAVFAHLLLHQCGASCVLECSIRKCPPDSHNPACSEKEWTCFLCSKKMRQRDRVRHEVECAELRLRECWVCGFNAPSLSEMNQHFCTTEIRKVTSVIHQLKKTQMIDQQHTPKFDYLDVEAVAKSEHLLLKIVVDGLCKQRQILEAVHVGSKSANNDVERYVTMQWNGTKKYQGYERFADARAFLVPSHGRQELITKPRHDGKHYIPRYLLIETQDELEEVLQYTDHSIAIRSEELVSCTQFGRLCALTHHVEVVGCRLRDVGVFANVVDNLDLRDNLIEDITPLKNVEHSLWLSRNLVTDVSALKCRSNLFLDHNNINDASSLKNVTVLDLRGNPLNEKENVKARNNTVFVD